MNRRISQLVLAIVSPVMFGWLAGVSSAQITQGPVTDLWNTGVDNSGVPLPNATVGDPHYTLVSVPSTASSTTLITVTTGNYPVYPAGGWVNNPADTPLSDWIGPGVSLNGATWSLQDPSIGGNFDYQTTFNVSTSGNFTITGQWSADNHGVDILLDGNSTGNLTIAPGGYANQYPFADPSYDFEQWTPFTITGTNLLGTNTLDFLTYNSVPSPVVTGLRVEFNSVPEPSTLVLLSMGAIGLMGYAWRRRRRKANRLPRTYLPMPGCLALLALLFSGLLAGVSSAQITQGPVTDLWNTGVSNSGVPLPNGTVGDPHYTFLSVPSGSSPTLVVATSAGGWPIPPWLADDSVSAWIGPNYRAANTPPGVLQDPAAPGDYDYQTTFALSTSGPFTITGQWSADSHGYDILWDGNSTGDSTLPGTPPVSPIDYEYWTPFTISGTAAAGTHTLDFLVDRTQTSTDTTGLRVEFTSVPEPSTLVLLSMGAVGLLGCVWGRRRPAGRRQRASQGQELSPRRLTLAAALACAAVLLSVAQLRAEVILPDPPPVYEIAFVTKDTTTATSSNIAVYNSFVTAEANLSAPLAALGVSWNAIVSTGGVGGVDADVNAPFTAGIPVYNTQGQLVADSGTPLYSGTLLNPIFYDQYGNSNTLSAWTGSTSSGTADPVNYMDAPSGNTEMGAPVFTNSTWLADFVASQVGANGIVQEGAIYALSSPIKTPEPASLTLLGAALLGLGGFFLARRRRG